MASVQCQKPVDHTKKHPQHAHGHGPAPGTSQNKGNNTSSHRKENEHSFTNKVKGKANSAYKKVADQMHHKDQQHNTGHQPTAGQKQASHGSGGVAEGKKKEGHMSNCIPKIGDHKRREKQTRKNKGYDCDCKDGSSSSSDSESDNDARAKHN